MSNSASAKASSSGIGLGGALFLLFTYLKLTGHIAWSWLWVTAPLWGFFALVLAVAAVCFVVWGVIGLYEMATEGRRLRRNQAASERRRAAREGRK